MCKDKPTKKNSTESFCSQTIKVLIGTDPTRSGDPPLTISLSPFYGPTRNSHVVQTARKSDLDSGCLPLVVAIGGFHCEGPGSVPALGASCTAGTLTRPLSVPSWLLAKGGPGPWCSSPSSVFHIESAPSPALAFQCPARCLRGDPGGLFKVSCGPWAWASLLWPSGPHSTSAVWGFQNRQLAPGLLEGWSQGHRMQEKQASS